MASSQKQNFRPNVLLMKNVCVKMSAGFTTGMYSPEEKRASIKLEVFCLDCSTCREESFQFHQYMAANYPGINKQDSS